MIETVGLSGRQRAGLAAALGAGVLVGAGSLLLYQRLSRALELRVAGQDFSQDIASLHSSIQQLRQELESMREEEEESPRPQPLRSALKRAAAGREDVQLLQLPGPSRRHRRSPSWSSGQSSGTDYYSALESEEEVEEGKVAEQLQQEFPGYTEQAEPVEFYARVDDLLEGSAEQQQLALRTVTDGAAARPGCPALLWRLCKAQYLCAVLAGQDGAADIKRDLIEEAVQAGRRALELDEGNPEAHKWFAIALGSRGEFQSVKEKILGGFEFKSHIDRAAELNPADPVTAHLLGRFCYEVSQLSWVERKMAATLFAAPPAASLPEAVEHFLRAEQLRPAGWKENRLFLAKCSIGQGEYNQAVIWLDRADSIPSASQDVREGIKVSRAEW